MSLERLLLALLVAAPAHGYALRARLAAELGVLRPVEPSHVYAALRRLERRGLVTAEVRRERQRTRRVYAVTAAGEAAQRDSVRAAAASSPLERPLLVRTALCALLGERPGAQVVRAERAARERVLAELRTLPGATALAALLCERARRHLEVELWLLGEVARGDAATPRPRASASR